MPPHDPAVGRADLGLMGHVFGLVGDVPGQARDLVGGAAGGFDDFADVAKGLLHLPDEIVRLEHLVAGPADLAAYIQRAILGQHAVGITPGRGPPFGLNDPQAHLSPSSMSVNIARMASGQRSGRPRSLTYTIVAWVVNRGSPSHAAVI